MNEPDVAAHDSELRETTPVPRHIYNGVVAENQRFREAMYAAIEVIDYEASPQRAADKARKILVKALKKKKGR